MKIHQERAASVTKQASVAFSFTHNLGRVTEFWEAKSHSDLGICYPVVSAEGMDIGMDIGESEGGAEFVYVPGDQSACMADQSVAWSGTPWLMSWQWTLEVWVIAFQRVIHGERPVRWHPPRAVIEFTILCHSSPSIYGTQINKCQNHEIPTAIHWLLHPPRCW